MAYSPGSKITATDYNAFVTRLNKVWGTGTGNYGYGQPELPTVATSDEITDDDWADMVNAITACGNHQNTTLEDMGDLPATSNKIATINELSNNITRIDDNRMNVHSGASYTDTNLNPDDRINIYLTTNWPTFRNHIFTVTFPSVDFARNYFNMGNAIRLRFKGYPKGTTSSIEQQLIDFLDDNGYVDIYADHWEIVDENSSLIYLRFTETILKNTGYYDLSTSNLLLFLSQNHNNTDQRLRIEISKNSSGSQLTIKTRLDGNITTASSSNPFEIDYMTHVFLHQYNHSDALSYLGGNPTNKLVVTDLTFDHGVVLSPNSITVIEGNDKNLNVKLSRSPDTAVTITATKNNNNISISPSSRTFTSSNWSTFQVFTISALSDSDMSDDTSIITLSPSNTFLDVDVDVNITDVNQGTILSWTSNYTSYGSSVGALAFGDNSGNISSQYLEDSVLTQINRVWIYDGSNSDYPVGRTVVQIAGSRFSEEVYQGLVLTISYSPHQFNLSVDSRVTNNYIFAESGHSGVFFPSMITAIKNAGLYTANVTFTLSS